MLAGKIAIVTGASRGIGETIAKGLAAVGANVILMSRNQQSLDRVSAEITKPGGKALPLVADIGIAEEIQRTVDTLTGTFLFCQAAGKIMIRQGGGKIINMVSVGAVVGFPRQMGYCDCRGESSN